MTKIIFLGKKLTSVFSVGNLKLMKRHESMRKVQLPGGRERKKAEKYC